MPSSINSKIKLFFFKFKKKTFEYLFSKLDQSEVSLLSFHKFELFVSLIILLYVTILYNNLMPALLNVSGAYGSFVDLIAHALNLVLGVITIVGWPTYISIIILGSKMYPTMKKVISSDKFNIFLTSLTSKNKSNKI